MIQLFNVTKVYPNGVKALVDVNLEIAKGEFVFLTGPSGAGKTTLLKLLFREDVPTRGQIMIGGRSIVRLKPSEVPYLRRKLGIVFQDFRLLEDRTVAENVAFALEVMGYGAKDIRQRVARVLDLVGLTSRAHCFPHQLSGGEQQRCAIARAMVNGPQVVLADEPTGNLDFGTAMEIVNLFKEINCRGATVIMATHNREIVNALRKRVIYLHNGRVVAGPERGAVPVEA